MNFKKFKTWKQKEKEKNMKIKEMMSLDNFKRNINKN